MNTAEIPQSVTHGVTEAPSKPSRKGIGGAPKNNANRTRSGKRAWTAVKRLPKSSGLIRVNLYAERDETEAAVCLQHGEVSLYHAALVQSSLRHSGRAQLLERWLRTEPDLATADKVRDGLIALIDIGRRQPHLYKLMFSNPPGDPTALARAAERSQTEFLAVVASLVGERDARRFAALLIISANGIAGSR